MQISEFIITKVEIIKNNNMKKLKNLTIIQIISLLKNQKIKKITEYL